MGDFKSPIWASLSDDDVKAFLSLAVSAEILRSRAIVTRARATKPFFDELVASVKNRKRLSIARV